MARSSHLDCISLAVVIGCALGPCGLALSAESPAGAKDDPEIKKPTEPEASGEERDRQRSAIRRYFAGILDQDIEKVKAAIDGLLKTGSPLAAEYFWQLYASPYAQRRHLALEALAQLEAPKDQDRLFQQSLREPMLSLRRRASAIWSAKTSRDAAAKAYFQVTTDAETYSPLFRFRAVQLLAHVGGKSAGSCLLKCLASDESEIAVAAAEGLATLGEPRNVPAMVRGLDTRDPELAPALADALQQLTGTTHRFNLVKWEQWEEDYQSGALKDPKQPDAKPPKEEASGESYVPDYRNPYDLPVTESALDFVVVHDTTGSLRRIWLKLVSQVDAVMNQMAKRIPSVRMGVVRYRADEQQLAKRYDIAIQPLTRDLQKARTFLEKASMGGDSGGWNVALQQAISTLAWRANARKALLVIGETTPQTDQLSAAFKLAEDAWVYDSIQCNVLLAPTSHHDDAQRWNAYGELAKRGAGRFYQYLRDWERLGDMTPKFLDARTKIDHEIPEQPADTLEKWITPVALEKEKK